MKSLDYLADIMKNNVLSKSDMMDILEKIGYMARDNGLDDSITGELMDVLEKQ